MNKERITYIAIGLVVFILGLGVGIVYQQAKMVLGSKRNPVLEVLNSRTIPFVTAYGDIVDIRGKNIAINFEEDSLTVKIKDDAPVYSFESGVQKIIKVEDLKKGDKVSVNLKLSQDGQAEGLAIVLIASAAK